MSTTPVLFASLRSPFARRIRLALNRLDITFETKMVDVFQENPELIAANPLGLVPTLVTAHGAIADSNAILEFLDETHGGIWPDDTRSTIAARQVSVLASGIMQSLVLYFQEAKLHEVPSPRWLKEHVDSIDSTLNYLNQAPESVWFTTAPGAHGLTQGAWDLCVALEYSDLRLPEYDWRKKFPALVKILDVAKKNPFFVESNPPK